MDGGINMSAVTENLKNELEQLREVQRLLQAVPLTAARTPLVEAVRLIAGEVAACELQINYVECLEVAKARGEAKFNQWYDETVPEDKHPLFPTE